MTDSTSPKTSISHPLRIDRVDAPGGGMIGMTFCPGRMGVGASSGTWDRDLDIDLDRIRDWGAVAVLTLMEEQELAECKVGGIGSAVRDHGMTWHHLPIVDVDVPGEVFEQGWLASGPELRADLAARRKILLHCLGGLGRTGTIAARLLVELGVPAEEAIALVRKARPGTIETRAQEAHVRSITAMRPVPIKQAAQPNGRLMMSSIAHAAPCSVSRSVMPSAPRSSSNPVIPTLRRRR